MKRLHAAATALLVCGALTLTGCGDTPKDPPPVRVTAKVTGKKYKAATYKKTTVDVYSKRCTGRGRKKTCTKTKTGTKTVRKLSKPACYELDLDNGRDECVAWGTWISLNPGSTYTYRTH